MNAPNPTKDLFDNPLGTDGFEFVEFTSPDPETLKTLWELMGFTAVGKHRSKNVLHFRQGDINFILNMEPVGQPADFQAAHGPSANAMAFRVRDAAKAYELALQRGAKPATPGKIGPMELNIPASKASGAPTCTWSTAMARRASMTSISPPSRARRRRRRPTASA